MLIENGQFIICYWGIVWYKWGNNCWSLLCLYPVIPQERDRIIYGWFLINNNVWSVLLLQLFIFEQYCGHKEHITSHNHCISLQHVFQLYDPKLLDFKKAKYLESVYYNDIYCNVLYYNKEVSLMDWLNIAPMYMEMTDCHVSFLTHTFLPYDPICWTPCSSECILLC